MGRPPRISRDQILAAARSEFTERGFAAATLADIAAALGVTPGAILRHFESKQALFGDAMSPPVTEPPACVLALATVDGTADPRLVLRRFAEEFVPFVRSVLGASLAVSMHVRARRTTLLLPFDTSDEANPAQRGIRLITAYFRRAMRAGTIELGDPRAAALLFVGSLQSYVLIHHVLNVAPVYPLAAYLDALIDLWTRGAIRKPPRRGARPRTLKAPREG